MFVKIPSSLWDSRLNINDLIVAGKSKQNLGLCGGPMSQVLEPTSPVFGPMTRVLGQTTLVLRPMVPVWGPTAPQTGRNTDKQTLHRNILVWSKILTCGENFKKLTKNWKRLIYRLFRMFFKNFFWSSQVECWMFWNFIGFSQLNLKVQQS